MRIAITRGVSPSIGRCELTHLARSPIDLDVARAQHAAYERCLAEAGCVLQRIDASADLPDSVFVEDAAVVFDELAVVARPGAASRRPETDDVAAVLARYRTLCRLEAPATLDGGDVIVAGRRVFVGRSGRTNAEGIDALRGLLAPHGYTVEAVDVTGCLHLKSAATRVGDGLLLVNPAWVDPAAFRPLAIVEVDPAEPCGANALAIGRDVVYAAGFPRTRARLEARGVGVREVEAGELAKAEGAVTCCSLVFDA